MKFTRSFVAIMAIAALTACDDDDDPTDEGDVIAGEYTVSEFRYTADAAGGPTVDLAGIGAAQGGPYGILEMTVDTDNSFAGVLRLPTAGGPQNFNIGGDIELSGSDNITIDFNAATEALGVLDPEESGTYDLNGNTLTITLPDVSFDYGALAGTPSGEIASDLRIVGSRS